MQSETQLPPGASDAAEGERSRPGVKGEKNAVSPTPWFLGNWAPVLAALERSGNQGTLKTQRRT